LKTDTSTSNIFDKLNAILKSRKFYYFVIGFFIFESIWIAFSAVYPQAFDENFHFGLIKMYSHYWLPFITHAPAGSNAYGAVTRDPSYLYHYLMSFPYRFINLFDKSQTFQVIALRLIDVGFFTEGLVLFKRIMEKVGVSKGLVNASLFIFILIPIVPQLAAQVNYDDLLFPLTAWTILQGFRLTDELKSKKPSAKTLLLLLSTIILSSLVKYAYMPIGLAVVLFLIVFAYKSYKNNFTKLWRSYKLSFKRLSKYTKIGLVALLVLSLGMFAQRDGYNLIKYHSLNPDCAKVITVNQCKAYSAWNADYLRHNQVLNGQISTYYNIKGYTMQWFYWMWYRLFFAVNGANSNFANNPPLPLPSIAAAILGFAGAIAIIRWRSKLFHKNPYVALIMAVGIIYSISLFAKGYATYQYTATLENMNGRYLLPILLPLAAVAGLAFSQALKRSTPKKIIAVVIVFVLFLQGGGILTFMLRSDSTWYWNNPTVVKVNNTAKTIANHVVVKKKYK
jgi:hypothetical protein